MLKIRCGDSGLKKKRNYKILLKVYNDGFQRNTVGERKMMPCNKGAWTIFYVIFVGFGSAR